MIVMDTRDVVFVEVHRDGVWTLWRVELAAKREDGWLYDTTLITPEDAVKELQEDAAYREEAP